MHRGIALPLRELASFSTRVSPWYVATVLLALTIPFADWSNAGSPPLKSQNGAKVDPLENHSDSQAGLSLANSSGGRRSAAFESVQAARDVFAKTRDPNIAIRSFIDILKCDDPEAKSLAAFFLGSFGSAAADALPSLKDLLSDGLPSVRLHAAEAILKINPSESKGWEVLRGCLHHPDSNIRYMTVFALAGASDGGEPKVLELLMSAMSDADSQVAAASAVAGEFARNSIVQRTPQSIAVWQAELAEQIIPIIDTRPGLGDEDRTSVSRNLGLAGEAASNSLPELRALILDSNAIARATALRAIWLIEGRPDSVMVHLQGLLNANDDTATTVIQTLGEIGPPASDLLPAILTHASLQTGAIQIQAGLAAAKIAPADTRGWDVISSMRRDEDCILRLLSVMALTNVGALRPDFVENELRESVRDRNLRVRAAATEGLHLIHASNAPDGGRQFGRRWSDGTQIVALHTQIPSEQPNDERPSVSAVALLPIVEDIGETLAISPLRDEDLDILSPSASLHVPTTSDSIPPLPATAPTQANVNSMASQIPQLPLTPSTHDSNELIPKALPSALEDVVAALDKPIERVRADVQTLPGDLPPNHAAAKLLEVTPLRHGTGITRSWYGSHFGWAPTALCHNALYFEEQNAERYGYHFGIAQGLVSGVHFFGTVPTLPYRLTANPPWECLYTLGLDRPGNCVPFRYHRLPWHTGAAIVQAGAMAGIVFLVP